jgi:hypothetical protein
MQLEVENHLGVTFVIVKPSERPCTNQRSPLDYSHSASRIGSKEIHCMVTTRRFRRLAMISVIGLVGWTGCGQAQAQWGFDYGFGIGFGLGHQTPASVSYLNDHSLARGAAAAASRPQSLRAPIPVSRDVDFFNRYDVETRIAMEEGVARRRFAHRAPTTTTRNQTAPGVSSPPSPPPRPLIPLASFFDAARRLVWPADAPTRDDFAAKKVASDAKTLELLEELEGKGYARISTAADARNMLLNYGQPALQFLRDTTTPRLSDAFHIFLMSLYDSIGQTTEPTGK